MPVLKHRTAPQGELPANMKQFWRFLLRKNLPADSLSGLTHAVFGLGDSGSVSCPLAMQPACCTSTTRSLQLEAATHEPQGAPTGYVHYNVVAKKLTRRLEALGSKSVIEQGLGDDQHPHGYEAALDPWLARLWATLRAQHPLSPGVTEASSWPLPLMRRHATHIAVYCHAGALNLETTACWKKDSRVDL